MGLRTIGVPLEDGVGRVPGFVNAYVFEDPSGLYLIDTTMNRHAKPVRQAFDRAGVRLSQVGTILLTHAHVDHMRGAPELAAESRAPVVCHEKDAPAVEGRVPPRIPAILRLFVKIHPVPVGRHLKDGDMVGPLQVVYAPGHTLGEVAFYHPARKILFSGDSVVERKGKLVLPATGFAEDIRSAAASLEILRKLDIELLLPGHGVPVRKDIPALLDELIAASAAKYRKA